MGLDGGLNTYGYVGGNALGAVDPNGLMQLLPVLAGGGAATGGTAIGLGETINLGLAISLIYNMPDTSDNAPPVEWPKKKPGNMYAIVEHKEQIVREKELMVLE